MKKTHYVKIRVIDEEGLSSELRFEATPGSTEPYEFAQEVMKAIREMFNIPEKASNDR